MNMMKKNFVTIAIALGIIFAGLGAYFANQKLEPEAPKDSAVQTMMALTLKDSQGKPQALTQYQGQFLVVNFWATWCPPCVDEMPELTALQEEFHVITKDSKTKIQILGIGIDSPSNIAEFSQKYKISYPLFSAGMEGTELTKKMGNKAGGLPFTVLVSPEGQIVKSYMGRLKMEELKKDILAFSKL
jgi:peroxiredoxin